MRILICYDGSTDARCAIDRAATLFPGADARILVVWDTASAILTGAGFGTDPYPGIDYDELEQDSEERAQRLASDGAELAGEAGLLAHADPTRLLSTSADTILDAAERLDADAIIMGTRGRSTVGSLRLGSVSHAVLQHADRSVVVITSPQLAHERADHRHRQEDGEKAHVLGELGHHTHWREDV